MKQKDLNEVRKVVREVVQGSYEGDASSDYHLTDDDNEVYFGNFGAGIIGIREDGKMLLCKRSQYVNEPGTWSYPGGKIESAEDTKSAAIRELQEETNYNGPIENIHLLEKYEDQDNNFTYWTYIANITDFKAQLDWENEKVDWFSIDELPSPLHFGFEAVLPKLKQYLTK